MESKVIKATSMEVELDAIKPMADQVESIKSKEFKSRINKACSLLGKYSVKVMYLHSGTNLFYFTGTEWNPSERMVGALLFQDGSLEYLVPEFEIRTIQDYMQIRGKINAWQEHENPYTLFSNILLKHGISEGNVFMDESAPFFVTNGILSANKNLNLINAQRITANCRMFKSEAEIKIIQMAMNITLEVQKAVARILKAGMSPEEVAHFINEAHKRYGISSGSYFCIVLFGSDTAFPHGVKKPKKLALNEIVLVDTGCKLHGYTSDITRTYVFGRASKEQKRIWNIEKAAQLEAFKAAQLGMPCEVIDFVARQVIEHNGLKPEYNLPGLPHRTGHGIGLDIHEWPYMVKNDKTIIKPGLCFSIEPMICVPNQFGIRHEDHVYITEKGPRWFTQPMFSLEEPFGQNKKAF